jgi:hypothetical protein
MCACSHTNTHTHFLILPGAKLSLVESFGLLSNLFPFPLILDAGYPVLDLQLADVLFDVILPSILGSSLLSFSQVFPVKYLLNCSGIHHPLYMTKPT